MQLHSHQIFHIFVVAGALVHYHGIMSLVSYILSFGDCMQPELIETFL